MSGTPPPIRTPIADRAGGVTPAWAGFFNNMFEGDTGEDWTPVWTALTEVGGAAEITGRLSRLNQSIIFFDITIVPVTSVSAVAGSTYAEGFPLEFLRDSVCNAVHDGVGEIPGHIEASTGKIYIPALSAVSSPVTITGMGFVR